MSSDPVNQLVIISDEHARRVTGCYGDTIVQTPNIDRLSERGTRFRNAYTPSPICVPARAALATGLYTHVTANWDNASPYNGDTDSWGHALQQAGIPVGSIGKLHFRAEEDPVGFDFQHLPLHVVNGTGDVLGCVREPLPLREKGVTMARNIGPGETSYTSYDRDITARTIEWLNEKSPADEPWTLFVSLVCPHFPLVAPDEYYALYASKNLMPSKPEPDDFHPWLNQLKTCINHTGFDDEKTHTALTAYYGLVTFMDAQVGEILHALAHNGLTDSTRIIYTSDHGDNMGERGLWGKSTMYEESAGIPLIICGPGCPERKINATPVTLLDMYPTLVEGASADLALDRPGRSLVAIANEPDDYERVVFSEYHAMGSASACFMIRQGDWKLIHYVGYEPQLFNLTTDPGEQSNLANNLDYADICNHLMSELLSICDPDEVDRRAKSDQKRKIDQHGGQEAVVKKGGFGATPPPGEQPQFAS